ncbi:hypothetical protein RHMOL_Rhmol09G0113000 [Rhododendron molle]|uniref:Uncharacterized protein n=1 Tax=Rhododendron molle TaxID=49168 RepID=A0ACC0MC03_RHOML|nr:hypothetical protein RHMOL_Rhmol09G0113000 [Rhododendron molle]
MCVALSLHLVAPLIPPTNDDRAALCGNGFVAALFSGFVAALPRLPFRPRTLVLTFIQFELVSELSSQMRANETDYAPPAKTTSKGFLIDVVIIVISMMARSKAKARKSILPPTKVNVKKGALVNEGSSSQKEQRKPSGFAVYVKDFTRGLKKIFKEDNIIKQIEVMATMSEWWNAGYWRKKYDPNYDGSSSDEQNDEDDVNDDESSEEEGNNCPPRPKKKKKSKGERKIKKKVPGIEIFKLENVIKEGNTDRRFHRAYMLFTLACLLCPTTKEVGGNRLFPGVVADDLETIKTYKWPAFVLDWLVNQIRNYKICIDKYKDFMRQFMSNSKFLHEMDAAMGEPSVRSPVVGIPVEDEGDSPQFSGNFEHQNDEQGEGEEDDQIQQMGEEEEDGDQIKEIGDDIE